MEFITGKIKKVELTGDALSDFFKEKLNAYDFEEFSNGDYVPETSGFLKIGEHFYEFLDYNKLDECGDSLLHDNGDGTFNFIALYYNGGGDLSELLEDEFKHLEKEKQNG